MILKKTNWSPVEYFSNPIHYSDKSTERKNEVFILPLTIQMDNQRGYWKECLYTRISANKWKNNRIRISLFLNPHKLVDLGINHQQLLVSQKERQPDYMYFMIEDQNTFTKFSSFSHLKVLNVVK